MKAVVFLAGTGLVALAAIAVWLDRQPNMAPNRVSMPEVSASAGAIYSTKVTGVDGKEILLGRWEGKLLLVNFWATWCAPCREEIPMLERLQNKHSANGLQIIGIAADSRVNVDKFSQDTKLVYPLFADEAGAIELSKRLGNRLGLLPFTVLIQPGGDVLMTHMGIINEREIDVIAAKFGEKLRK